YTPLLSCHGDHRDLHSFPTRRSSDLPPVANYVNAVRTGNLLFLAGKGPSAVKGKLGAEFTVEQGYQHARSVGLALLAVMKAELGDRKSTRLNSSHVKISYAVFCLKKK